MKKIKSKINSTKSGAGFSLIEILVVIGIIGLLAGVILIAINPARAKARDVRRKAELKQIGQFLSGSSCYIPNAGAGDYDLATLIPELQAKYPQYASFIANPPMDPKSGSTTQTNYRYIVTDDSHCDLYANLENQNEAITLTSLTAPTAGGGTGILSASSNGPNGTSIYYQVGK